MYKIKLKLQPPSTDASDLVLSPQVIVEFDGRSHETTLKRVEDALEFIYDVTESSEVMFTIKAATTRVGRLYVYTSALTLGEEPPPLPPTIVARTWEPDASGELCSGLFSGPALLLHHWAFVTPQALQPKNAKKDAHTPRGSVKFKHRPRFNGD